MGEIKHDGLAVPGRVVLAHELPFTLGLLRIDPPTRQVSCGGRSETLEPRVMQVLVALARAGGSIITRDELIERCWEGRVVGEDAINRVISRLRHLADQFADAYRVETITKVGYRLVAAAEGLNLEAARPAAAVKDRSNHPWRARRRTVLAGGMAAAVAAALGGGLAWQWSRPHRPSAEALELYRRGDIAQRSGDPDQVRQAAAFFERAVRVDPLFAGGWGGLALAYTHHIDGYAEAELESLPGRIRSAADRALELDPENADAQLALACIPRAFRNWQTAEEALAAVQARHPGHWLANGRLAMFLYQVGRLDEGVRLHRRVMAIDPLIIVPYLAAARASASAGKLHDAEVLLRAAQDRWPAHPLLWFSRFNFLLYTGRPEAAAAFVRDPDALPSGFGPELVESRLTLARAVRHGRKADVESTLKLHQQNAAADARSIASAAPLFALLGRVDLAFAALDRYYFDRGSFGSSSPISPSSRRYTDFLFSLPMAAARRDPRFAQLTRDIGLDDYWRATGTRPTIQPS